MNNTKNNMLPILSIDQVNSIVSEHFIKIFGNVVEHYPPAAIGILKNRPFSDAADVSTAINRFLDALTVDEKIKVLQLYPDMVARFSDLSIFLLDLGHHHCITDVEQLTIEDKFKLGRLNRKYKEKFGFPFVIHGKQNRVATIFTSMETRIENNMETEVDLAINEVKKIGKLRIHEILH